MTPGQVPQRWSDALSGLRRGWASLDAPARAAAVGMFVLCALPKVSNYSPGALGYGLIAVLVTVACFAWSPSATRPRRLEALEVGAAALGGWTLLSTLWGAGDPVLRALVASLACLCALTPWLLWRCTTADRVMTVGYVCGAGTVGSLCAALPVTWLWHPRLVVLRPGLPIGGASNNAVGLILLAAAMLTMARVDRRGRPVWLWLAVADFALIAQSVSRAGWLVAGAFGAVVLMRAAGARRVMLAGVAFAGSMVAVALLLWVRGMSVFGDATRATAAGNGLEAWMASPASVLVGRGAGSVWPWIDEEVAWRHSHTPTSYLRPSETGELLYHAHSTFLSVLVEQGLVGFGLLVCVLALVCVMMARAIRRQSRLEYMAVALLLSVPTMLVELYLLRSFTSALVWWLVVWAVLLEASSSRRSAT